MGKGHNLALWAYKLEFNHPVTKERMVFVAYPPDAQPWSNFDIARYVENFSDGDDGETDGVPLYTNPVVADNLD